MSNNNKKIQIHYTFLVDRCEPQIILYNYLGIFDKKYHWKSMKYMYIYFFLLFLFPLNDTSQQRIANSQLKYSSYKIFILATPATEVCILQLTHNGTSPWESCPLAKEMKSYTWAFLAHTAYMELLSLHV